MAARDRPRPPTDRAAHRAAGPGGVPRSARPPRNGQGRRVVRDGARHRRRDLSRPAFAADHRRSDLRRVPRRRNPAARALACRFRVRGGCCSRSSSASVLLAGSSGSPGRRSPPRPRRCAKSSPSSSAALMAFVASLGLMPQGQTTNLGDAAARVGRSPDHRGRNGDRRRRQLHRDDRHRHLSRRRAAPLRPRDRVDAAVAPPRGLLPRSPSMSASRFAGYCSAAWSE